MASSFVSQGSSNTHCVYNRLLLKICGLQWVITLQCRKALKFEYKTSLLLKFLTKGSFFLAIFSSGLPILPISRDVFPPFFSLLQVLGLLKYLPPNLTGNGKFLLLYYLKQFGLFGSAFPIQDMSSAFPFITKKIHQHLL